MPSNRGHFLLVYNLVEINYSKPPYYLFFNLYDLKRLTSARNSNTSPPPIQKPFKKLYLFKDSSKTLDNIKIIPKINFTNGLKLLIENFIFNCFNLII